MHVITQTDELAKLCERLSRAPYITIDTEFIREKTYFPELCLVQLASADEVALVDPLSKDIDLAALFKLMMKSTVLKVFHACRQDIEIFYHLTGKIPTPIFDTQVAAMVCGYGESVGYEPLVTKLTGAALDKSARFTDWARRPLSAKQLTYAQADVTHLRQVYEKLVAQIEKADRMSWIEEEMADLSDPKNYETDPDEMWRRLKPRNKSGKYLSMLKELASWRELEAKKQNVPRGRVVKDETLLEIANTAPATVDELKQVRGFAAHLKATQIKTLLATIETARQTEPANYPKLVFRKPLPAGSEAVTDMLRLLLKMKCEEAGVALKLVASKDDLEELVNNSNAQIPAVSGWRHTLYGQYAQQLLAGKLGFTVNPKTKTLILSQS